MNYLFTLQGITVAGQLPNLPTSGITEFPVPISVLPISETPTSVMRKNYGKYTLKKLFKYKENYREDNKTHTIKRRMPITLRKCALKWGSI